MSIIIKDLYYSETQNSCLWNAHMRFRFALSIIFFFVHSVNYSHSWEITSNVNSTTVKLDGVVILEHSQSSPAVYIGHGKETVVEYHGNFNVSDYVQSRIPLTQTAVDAARQTIAFSSQIPSAKVTINFTTNGNWSIMMTSDLSSPYNRLWLRLKAIPTEKIYGGGEQFSYFNLRGRIYPIWTREQGTGRNKRTMITFLADTLGGGAGGDYHTTYWPQVTYVSSRNYALTSSSPTNYAHLDFRNDDFIELEFWQKVPELKLYGNPSLMEIVKKLADNGRQNLVLPQWLRTGAVVGLQGGTKRVQELVNRIRENDIKISGIWIQDWSGKITTTFGTRVFWDWKLSDTWYPNLENVIAENAAKGARFLAYINPHLNAEGELFKYAESQGYFIKRSNGSTYVQDFGEFNVGTIDFTNPAAYNWYKKTIIQDNLISKGFSGWMADFGEYTPYDSYFHDGSTGASMHNRLPMLWAKMNWDAISEVGKQNEIFFFMRAGSVGSAKYCACAWAGDQNVDWTIDDGIPSTVPATLSLAMSSGPGLSHFDIGGYTSILVLVRTTELFLRSAESAVFTPVMRTHEGNRPQNNAQLYDDEYTMKSFARLVKIFIKLSNYTELVLMENREKGIPAQRPLFLHYPNDTNVYGMYDKQHWEYLYGRDLLVAPVFAPNVVKWDAYLPANEEWVHLWSGNRYTGGRSVNVNASLGYPPVFYRSGSQWTPLFEEIRKIRNGNQMVKCCQFLIFIAFLITINHR